MSVKSWFVPTEFEEQGGKPVALTLKFGPGMEPRSAVTAWDPPRMYATSANGWIPGSPAIANEWRVEARGGGTCVIRIVQSLFASTDDWDYQLERAKGGLASFLEILRIYMTHFRGQRATIMKWMSPATGTDAENWDALTSALGLKGLQVGQRFAAPAGVPALDGVVEYLTREPYDALLRIAQPGPGVAALGATSFPGGPSMVAMNLYLYGDNAAATVARETPRWDAWFQERFPMPADTSTSA